MIFPFLLILIVQDNGLSPFKYDRIGNEE